MQNFGKAAIRATKNLTKGYSDTQAKVRDATSNDAWGPTGQDLNLISQLTYNEQDFIEIVDMLEKRLNDKGKNWRHVYKSLTVLDYCLHQGSENIVIYFKDAAYIVKTLKEFQYIDEEGKDQGANVRQKAKDISNLLSDETRLREERRARANMRDRMIRGATGDDEQGANGDENTRKRGGGKGGRSEDELRKAIEESKRSLAREQLSAEEADLQKAIKLSEEEEARRTKAVEDSNTSSLFDDNNQLIPTDQSNNPFPTNLPDPVAYTFGLQPQSTTSLNPYQQQMQEQAAAAEYLQQQQMAQQAQHQEYLRNQFLLHEHQQQQAQSLLIQQNQPLMIQPTGFGSHQMHQQNLFVQQQPLMIQPTGFGSNNPFAPQSPISPSPSSPQSPPHFNKHGTYESSTSPSLSSTSPGSPPPGSPQNQGSRPFTVKTRLEENQELANLFADREGGQDTFGNTGLLRYGHSNAGRLVSQQTANTSHNPFAIQQQQYNEQPFFSV